MACPTVTWGIVEPVGHDGGQAPWLVLQEICIAEGL